MLNVAIVIGTRPEAIKLAPVYRAFAAIADVTPTIVLTGQHGAVLNSFITLFDLDRRINLHARGDSKSISEFGGRLLIRLGKLFETRQFDAVVVQGDTTSALVGAMASAYARIPVAHVEAGLRSNDFSEPFPEELNRKMLASACRWHFAPTELAAGNLYAEGFRDGIHIAGNTVVDAALWTAAHPVTALALAKRFPGLKPRRIVLVTAHRRESFGDPMQAIATAIAGCAEARPDLTFVVPLHPNPAASKPMRAALDDLANVCLTDPLSYPELIGIMANAYAILSDSGGLQEEAPSFGVPVLVLRNVTERPEGVDRGHNRLVGTGSDAIIAAFEKLAREGIDYEARRALGNPFGDGQSGERIARQIIEDCS